MSVVRRIPAPVLTAIVVLIGCVIGLGILEGTARFLWKAPWYERLLAYQRKVQTYNYKKNRWGMRDDSPIGPKQAGTKRIFMLGDSFTFGLGVPEDEVIFPELLEQRLKARTFTSAPAGVELMNAGEPGTLTGDWVDTWNHVGVEYDPDVVVAVFFLRDGTETLLIPEFFMRIRENIVQRNENSYLYRNFYAYRMYRDRMDRADIAASYTQRFLNSYFGDRDDTAEWRRAQHNLKLLRDGAHGRQAKFALVIFPILVELNENYPFTEICDLLEEYGRSLGVPVYNLLPDFLGEDAASLWVSPWDQHPNAEGHRLVADALESFLTEQVEE